MSAVQGILDIGPRGGGHLRRRQAGYCPQGNDQPVPERVIRQYGLRTGDELEGETGSGRTGQ